MLEGRNRWRKDGGKYVQMERKFGGKRDREKRDNVKIISIFFCLQVMHGGLFSSDNVTLDDLRKIDRNRQPPDEG